MASTSQSIGTIDSNEPSVTSYLLRTGSSGSTYTSEVSQRPVTPADGIIRQEWYYTLYATLLDILGEYSRVIRRFVARIPRGKTRSRFEMLFVSRALY